MSAPASAMLTIERRDDAETPVIVLTGDLEAATVAQIADVLTATIVTEQPEVLVLDLAGVGFVDSAGLGEIVRANRSLSRLGGRLVLRSPNETTRLLLEITHLAGHLEIE